MVGNNDSRPIVLNSIMLIVNYLWITEFSPFLPEPSSFCCQLSRPQTQIDKVFTNTSFAERLLRTLRDSYVTHLVPQLVDLVFGCFLLVIGTCDVVIDALESLLPLR